VSEEYKLLTELVKQPSLAKILFEEVEDSVKAISVAQKAFEKRSTQLQSLINSLPSGKYKNVLGKLVEALAEGLEQTAKNASDVDPDSDKAADALASLSAAYSSMNKAIKQVLNVNLNLMSSLSKTILDSNLHKGEDKDIAMVTILEESDLLDDAKKALESAFKKSGPKPIKPYKGFLASVMDALFGESEEVADMANEILESQEELIDAILELTPIEIGKFAQAITNYEANDKAASDQISSSTDKATKEAGSDKISTDDETTDDETTDDETTDDDAGSSDTVKAAAKALRDKVTDTVGEPGGLLFDKLLDSGIFKDLGIDVKESLEKYALAPVLLEKKLSSDDFQTLLSTAIEDNKEAFDGFDLPKTVKDLNKLFKDEEIDLEIEEPPEQEVEEELTGEDSELTPEEVEQSDKLADDAEKALGNIPFGKLELTKLLKAFPELAGSGNKATTQRRAFRKAFNQAAGEEIFEESINDTLSRLRKLAGIK